MTYIPSRAIIWLLVFLILISKWSDNKNFFTDSHQTTRKWIDAVSCYSLLSYLNRSRCHPDRFVRNFAPKRHFRCRLFYAYVKHKQATYTTHFRQTLKTFQFPCFVTYGYRFKIINWTVRLVSIQMEAVAFETSSTTKIYVI